MSIGSDLSVAHGFEGPDFVPDALGPVDEMIFQQGPVCSFSHGYTSAWESASEDVSPSQWDVTVEPGTALSGHGVPDAAESATEHSLAESDEAAEWAALGRRALLRRMDED